MVIYNAPGAATAGSVIQSALWNASAKNNIEYFYQFVHDPTAGGQVLSSNSTSDASWKSYLPSSIGVSSLLIWPPSTDLLVYGPGSVWSGTQGSVIAGGFIATSGGFDVAAAARPATAGHVKAEAFDGGTVDGTTITASGRVKTPVIEGTGADLQFAGPTSTYGGGQASMQTGSLWATSSAFTAVGRPSAGHVKAEAFDGGTFSGTTITGSGTITGADLVVSGGAVWTNSAKVLATDLLISGPPSVSGYSGGQASVIGGSFWATSSAFSGAGRPGAGYIVGENVRATATFRGNQFTSESGSIAMFGPAGVVTTGGASVYLASLVATSSAYGNGSASPGAGVVQAEFLSAPLAGSGLLLALGGQMYDQTTRFGGSGTAPADGATTIRANADRLDILNEAGSTLLFRVADANTAPVWKGQVVWHAGNMGSGSTLDADLLDGSHASAFVATSGATMSGNLDTHGELTFLDAQDGVHLGLGGYLHDMTTASGLLGGAGNGSTQLTANDDRWDIVNESDGVLLFRVANANTAPVWKGNVVWHAGNDGPGSTLDADTVDGFQGAAFAQIAGSNMTGWLSWATNAVGVSFSQGGSIFDQSAATAGEQRSVFGAAGDILYVLTEDLGHALFRADYAATRPQFKGGDLALYSDVTTEATTRASADTTEATARASADTTEATARAAADTTLTNSITAATNNTKVGTPTANLTLTGTFQDVTSMTVTVDKDGYWLFVADCNFERDGSGTFTAEARLVVNGNPQTPVIRTVVTSTIDCGSMSWIINCTNGYVCKIQARDTTGSGNAIYKDYSNFTAVWLHA